MQLSALGEVVIGCCRFLWLQCSLWVCQKQHQLAIRSSKLSSPQLCQTLESQWLRYYMNDIQQSNAKTTKGELFTAKIEFTLRGFKVQWLLMEYWSLNFATSNACNNWTRRTSRSQLKTIECILARYCPMESQTGSPTRLEFMCVISTAYDQNDLAYRERSSAHNLARVSPIENIKLPLWSAINVLSDGIIISVLTKCGEWVVYA